jgi:hypothetical protein
MMSEEKNLSVNSLIGSDEEPLKSDSVRELYDSDGRAYLKVDKLQVQRDDIIEESSLTCRIFINVPHSEGSHKVWINYIHPFVGVLPVIPGAWFKGQQWHMIDIPNLQIGFGTFWTQWEFKGIQSEVGYKIIDVKSRPVMDGGDEQVVVDSITGSVGGGQVTVVRSGSGEVMSESKASGESFNWSLKLLERVAWGKHDIVIEQGVGHSPPIYSVNKKTIHLLKAPAIDSPGSGAVIALGRPILLKGKGAPNEVIDIMNGEGTVSHAVTTVLNDKSYEAAFNQANYPGGGSVVIMARHRRAGDLAWTTPRTIYLLAQPNITGPDGNSVQNTKFTLTGSYGNVGSKLKILLDPTEVEVGKIESLTSNTWSCEVTVPVGSDRQLVAVQERSGTQSVRNIPRKFKIRPAQVSDISAVVTSPLVVFKGRGYTGSKVKARIPGLDPQPSTVDVSASAWQTPAIKMVPSASPQTCYFLQSFDGIDSVELSHPVMVPTPVPKGTQVTLSGDVPTLRGNAHYWPSHVASIEVNLNGLWEYITVAPTGVWSATGKQALPPGSYTPQVRLGVNRQWSDYDVLEPVVVRPKMPHDILVTPNGLSPTITGKCWPLAKLSLKYSDEDINHPIDGNSSGTWTTRRPKLFTPGDHTFTITQTFGGQTSPIAGPTPFNIATPTPAIESPSSGEEVSLRPTIDVSNGYIGSVIKVYDARVASKVLGQHAVTEAGICSITLTDEFVSEDEHIIKVDQDYKGQKSASSAEVSFQVRLPKPLIKVPQATKSIERFADYSGIGWPNSKVFLTRVGFPDWVRQVDVDVLGEWKLRVQVDEVGPQTLAINQHYGTFTRAGDDQDFNVIPNAAVFETPADNERLMSQRTFSGFGYPGDTVSVVRQRYPTHIYGTVKVSEKGTWSIRSQYNIPIGHDLWVSVKQERDGYLSWSPARIVHLPSPESWIYEPAPGDWVGIYPWVCGRDTPGAQMTVASVFDSQQALAPITTADEYGRWRVQLDKPLPIGPNWVQVRASRPQPDGQADVVSDWVYSGRFIVEQMGTEFVPPTVKLPPRRSEVGLRPVLKGSGLSGAKIQITVANVIRAEAWVDRKGCWTARFKDEVPVVDGLTSYSIRQSRDGVWSRQLAPERSFKVTQVPDGFQAPVIDGPEPGDVVDSRFWLYGSAIPGAQVDVCQDLDVYATIEADAEGQWQVCINRVLAAGDFTFTARQTLDGKESQSTSAITVNVNELLPPPVQDPSEGTSVTPVTKVSGRGYPGATVTLLRSGSPYISWGAGEVDGFGYWEILTKPLPLGTFKMTGKQTLSDKPQSAWMVERIYYVSNAG